MIALLAVLRTVGTSVLGFAIAANLSFELFYENLPGEVGRIEPITALGGGLGEAIQAVAGQPLLSFVLLGDLAMSGSFFGGPGERLQGAAFEVAPDHGTAPLPPGTPNPTLPGLALHYHGTRGLPEEVVGLIGLRSDLIRGQGCDCVSAPDPNCVEGAADCPTTPLSCPR